MDRPVALRDKIWGFGVGKFINQKSLISTDLNDSKKRSNFAAISVLLISF